jgi:hypothetical protein
MIDLFGPSVRVSRKLARTFRSVQAIFSAHKKAHKTIDLECRSMTYRVVRAFQVIRVLLSRRAISLPAVGMQIMGEEDVLENDVVQECIALHPLPSASIMEILPIMEI